MKTQYKVYVIGLPQAFSQSAIEQLMKGADFCVVADQLKSRSPGDSFRVPAGALDEFPRGVNMRIVRAESRGRVLICNVQGSN